jgi:DNA-binding MarR family transcriptional regulator
MWEEGPIPAELGRFPGYLLARLGESSRRRFLRALEPLGLHPRQFGVMTIVNAAPGTSQQQLQERTGIDPSSMVAVIDDLEARGLAERRAQPGDRRVRAIYLTPQGEATLRRAGEIAGRLQKELLAPLSPDERRQLVDLLRKLASA